MAAQKFKTKAITRDTVTILNSIRAVASDEYKEKVRTAEPGNIKYVGQDIFSAPALENEFQDILFNRIGLSYVKHLFYTNPLKMLKKGTIDMGATVQEIWTDLASGYEYDYAVDDSKVSPFARVKPDISAAYHTLNWQYTYQQTANEPLLNQAFVNAEGLYGVVNSIMGSMQAAYEVDEWENTKSLINSVYKAGHTAKVKVSDVTDEASAKGLMKKIREFSNKITMPSRAYNAAGVMQTTPRNKQYLFMTAELESQINYDVLAYAFQLSLAEVQSRVIVIDDFGAEMKAAGVKCVMCDEDWFQIYDKMLRMESQYNPKLLYWNYFYHVWTIFSASPFANCIVFQTVDVENDITVTVNDASYGSAEADFTKAGLGDYVTVTAEAEEGYHLKSITSDDVELTVSLTDGTATFTMPNEDVEISVTFEADPEEVIEDTRKGTK